MAKLVMGVGTTGSGPFKATATGRATRPYSAWASMLHRCYSKRAHPSYAGCSVVAEWLSFQAFARWYSARYVPGWQLDKDIMLPGNRIYSPDTCCFVPAAINALLNHNKSNKGVYPCGVDWHKAKQMFRAALAVDGRRKTLGYFKTAEEAGQVYLLAKKENVARVAHIYRAEIGEQTFSALMKYPIDYVSV